MVLRTWRTHQGGNVAIIFAAIMLPVMGIIAAAIDYGRAGKVRDTLQAATSAAAQAASAHLGADNTLVEKEALSVLRANLPKDLHDLPIDVTIPNDRKSVSVSMATTVPTTLMAIMGKSEIPVEALGFSRRIDVAVMPTLPPGLPVATPGAVEDAVEDALRQFSARSPGRHRSVPVAPSPEEMEAFVRRLQSEVGRLEQRFGSRGPAPNADMQELVRQLQHMRR